MGNRFGIIDLGSNTFHILIVNRLSDGSFKEVYKERAFVGLAEKGLEKISKNAFDKGVKTLKHFKEVLDQHSITDFRAFGTAALRSAINSQEFINQVEDQTEIKIEVIGGSREAELIFKGVSLIADINKNDHIIMDVGGGSVEFILVKDGSLTWAKSYNVGVGVLHNAFHNSDPISKEERQSLELFLTESLADLSEQVEDITITSMIGASGSFEVVQSLNGLDLPTSYVSNIGLENFHQVFELLVKSTTQEREEMEGLPESRIKLIVVAMLLINKAIEIIQPEKLIISPYALKEGVLSELNV